MCNDYIMTAQSTDVLIVIAVQMMTFSAECTPFDVTVVRSHTGTELTYFQ